MAKIHKIKIAGVFFAIFFFQNVMIERSIEKTFNIFIISHMYKKPIDYNKSRKKRSETKNESVKICLITKKFPIRKEKTS